MVQESHCNRRGITLLGIAGGFPLFFVLNCLSGMKLSGILFIRYMHFTVLKTADTDMSEVEKQSYNYYKKALSDGTHTAYLIFDEGNFAGAGGISYFQVMPTYHNPSGNKAYIMNMYTKPEYRRKGIAYRTLDMLVRDAKNKGITAISLEATDMGRSLYEKYGFVRINNEMELKGGVKL